MNPAWLQQISPVFRGAGEGDFPAYWVEPSRLLYEHQLVLIREGSMVLVLEKEEYFFEEDTFLIVPPGCVHVSREAKGALLRRAWVHFDWRYVAEPDGWPVMTYLPADVREDWIKHAPAEVPARFLYGAMDKPQEAWDLHKRFLNLCTMGEAHALLRARAVFLELLIHLLDDHRPRPIHGRSSDALIRAVREILDDVATHPQGFYASLRDAFKDLECSYEHASRAFKSQYGLAPVAYVNMARLERARQLLRDTSLQASDIAFEVGYPNVSYFNRLFKRSEGMTPVQYRQVYVEG